MTTELSKFVEDWWNIWQGSKKQKYVNDGTAPKMVIEKLKISGEVTRCQIRRTKYMAAFHEPRALSPRSLSAKTHISQITLYSIRTQIPKMRKLGKRNWLRAGWKCVQCFSRAIRGTLIIMKSAWFHSRSAEKGPSERMASLLKNWVRWQRQLGG